MSYVVESSRSFKNKVAPIHSKIKIASAMETESFDLGLGFGDRLLSGGPSFFQTGSSHRRIIDIMLLTVLCIVIRAPWEIP